MALDTAEQDVISLSKGKLAKASHLADVAGDISVVCSNDIFAAERAWRALEAPGIESPGQSFDFVCQWVKSFAIPENEQLYISVMAGTRPVVLLALHRTKKWGMDVLTSFSGDHVGSNAPLVDVAYFAGLTPTARAQLWQQVTASLEGASLLYLCDIPDTISGVDGIYSDFGISVEGDQLHRAVFPNWEQCNQVQRSRSRRKHDKQQGAKLDAMGEVSFEVIEAGDAGDEVIDAMFVQRGVRFKQQGIADPFEQVAVRDFYKAMFASGDGLKGRLHVLRLDGEIVAVRYNLLMGARIFCLISSMDTSEAIRPGSPGKQCLLRVMQSEFDNGYDMFDMGAGLTDEKRHWCNSHIQLRHYYVPLNWQGQVFAQTDRLMQQTKSAVKGNAKMFAMLKNLRAKFAGK